MVLKGLPADASLNVFDLRGQEVTVLRNGDSLLIEHLQSGMYFVRIRSNAWAITVSLIKD